MNKIIVSNIFMALFVTLPLTQIPAASNQEDMNNLISNLLGNMDKCSEESLRVQVDKILGIGPTASHPIVKKLIPGLNPKQKGSSVVLLELLNSDSDWIQNETLIALSKQNLSAQDAVPRLLRFITRKYCSKGVLKDNDEYFGTSILLLSSMGQPAVPILKEYTNSKIDCVPAVVQTVLKEMNVSTPENSR
jgi:hypothetical protein